MFRSGWVLCDASESHSYLGILIDGFVCKSTASPPLIVHMARKTCGSMSPEMILTDPSAMVPIAPRGLTPFEPNPVMSAKNGSRAPRIVAPPA